MVNIRGLRFTCKGGEGSGWYAPPKGTHVSGSQNRNISLFHGTGKQALEGILSEGLVPGKKRNWLGARWYVKGRGESVYMTDELEKAKFFGVESIPFDATEVIIVEVNVKGLNLLPDEYESHSYRYEGIIEPNRIVRVMRYAVRPETEELPLRSVEDLEFIEEIKIRGKEKVKKQKSIYSVVWVFKK